MKWKIFLLLYFSNYGLSLSENTEKLSESACKIASEVLKKENWIKTIAIVEFENNFKDDVSGNLQKCLPWEVTKVLMSAKEKNDFEEMRVHCPSVVVMIADNYQKMTQLTLMVQDFYTKPVLNHNSKFIVLTSTSNKLSHSNMKRFLDTCSIIDYTIIYEELNEIFMDNGNKLDSEKVFVGKPKALKNEKYHIWAYEQNIRVKFVNGIAHTKLMHFFNAVAKIEKSQSIYITTKANTPQNLHATLSYLITNRIFDITLNTVLVQTDNAPNFMTYEAAADCALVPMVEMKGGITFFKPFDASTWLMILIMIISVMILWRFGSSETSMWFVPFFFWAFYHGQSVNFPSNRKILIVVLQISVFMLLILGNAYQGLITSFMIAEDEPQKFETFDELLESGHKAIVGTYFDVLMQWNPKYKNARIAGQIDVLKRENQPVFEAVHLLGNKTALVMNCEVALAVASNSTKFYVLDEKLFPRFVRLQTIYLSKYLRRWQLLMDWSFEAGLPQAWERFEKDEKVFKEVSKDENPEGILKLGDISVVFYVLIAGYLLGGFILLCEIFWHGFGEPYMRLRKSKKENLNLMENQERKLTVRRIQVAPVNDENDETEV